MHVSVPRNDHATPNVCLRRMGIIAPSNRVTVCQDSARRRWLRGESTRRIMMTNSPDRHARTMLPIPDRPQPGLTTYDAKDGDDDHDHFIDPEERFRIAMSRQ